MVTNAIVLLVHGSQPLFYRHLIVEERASWQQFAFGHFCLPSSSAGGRFGSLFSRPGRVPDLARSCIFPGWNRTLSKRMCSVSLASSPSEDSPGGGQRLAWTHARQTYSSDRLPHHSLPAEADRCAWPAANPEASQRERVPCRENPVAQASKPVATVSSKSFGRRPEALSARMSCRCMSSAFGARACKNVASSRSVSRM